jgi:hypothetical protein
MKKEREKYENAKKKNNKKRGGKTRGVNKKKMLAIFNHLSCKILFCCEPM